LEAEETVALKHKIQELAEVLEQMYQDQLQAEDHPLNHLMKLLLE
jgi:hypothetical protein